MVQKVDFVKETDLWNISDHSTFGDSRQSNGLYP
jgi:hypothetical protein